MGARTTGKVRVLLVDDLSDIRLVMRLLLEADGRVEVVGEAADGAEAARLAGELRPDAVVLDLRMPGMDGVSALPLIRDAAPGAVVVALSALPVGPATDRAVDLRAQARPATGGQPRRRPGRLTQGAKRSLPS